LLKTVTKGDKVLIRGFNGWYWLIPGLQKGKNQQIWWFLLFIFKDSKWVGVNRTFYEDLYLPLFDGVGWSL